MQPASLRLEQPHLEHWPSVVGHIASVMDLEASARQHKALRRKRGVRSADALLHLALLYGPGGLSLRSAASYATEAGLADLCDVSLLERLRNAGAFLSDVLTHLLAHRRGEAPTDGRLRLSLVDGSTVSVAGSTGSDWRLHARYEPARGGFSDLVVTEASTAEALCCVAVHPGDVLVQDRGYARLRNFTHARSRGADFITRIGWCSVKLFHPSGAPFDLIAALSSNGPALTQHAVRIGAGGNAVTARLIIARKPPEATERQQRKLRRKASRKGHKTDPRTLLAAGFLMLLTSLPETCASAEEVVRLYRLRWQIELAFKRLKSLAGFDHLQASDPKLARSWLLAHLIAAVLIEASLGEALDAPPLSASHPLARDGRASGVPGCLRTAACRSDCSARCVDGRAWRPAAPPDNVFQSHHDDARPKHARHAMLYPSAYGAMPLPATAQGRLANSSWSVVETASVRICSRRRTERLAGSRASTAPTSSLQVRSRRRAPHRAGHACRATILPTEASVYAASATVRQRRPDRAGYSCAPAAGRRSLSAAAATAGRSTALTAARHGRGIGRCVRRHSGIAGRAAPGGCRPREQPAGGRAGEKE